MRRNVQQVNVREADILDQLGTAVDAIALTPDIADAIAEGLNATHRAAMQDKARAAQKYRAAIAALKEKQDRFFDRYDREEIDRDTYDRQLARVRADEAELFEKLREADAVTGTKYLVTAERVLQTRNASGNAGATRRSVTSSPAWFVTRAWRGEPSDTT